MQLFDGTEKLKRGGHVVFEYKLGQVSCIVIQKIFFLSRKYSACRKMWQNSTAKLMKAEDENSQN